MTIPTVITLLAAIWSGGQAIPRDVGPKGMGDLGLRLECISPHKIRFELRNDGTADTTVAPGMVVGNGHFYMINGLELIGRTPAGSQMVYEFRPHRYPVAIAGTLAQWLEAIPVRGALRMAASPADFAGNSSRLDVFPADARLSLRWTIPEPRPERMMLFFWSGTLTSNTCATDAAR